MGKENIPKEGPIIFVGNHQNQFLDPTLLTASLDIPVGFIVARKSYDMSLVGDFAKIMRAIPVSRPQDYAKRGIGMIVSYEDGIVTGEETQFKSQVKVNESIFIDGSSETPTVLEIISDTQIKVKTAFDNPITKKMKYKIFPHIDHTEVYKTVWERLCEKKNIGIFPEGGSHDRPHLLPLKAGVTLMALGAMNKDPKCKITIVPCGLNYFQGHRFRSHVLVQFGSPIVIPQELVSLYQTNKREACGKLLALIEEGLLNVVVNYPDYKVMQIAQLTRKLYQPENKNLPAEEFLRLQQRLIKGFIQMQELPKVKEMAQKVSTYGQHLKKYGLNDNQVKTLNNTSVWLIVPRMLYFLFLLIISFPGNILLFPIAAIARPFAQKKAKISLQNSSVKIRGNDVIASYKVMTGLVLIPLFMVLYTLICMIIFGWKTAILFALFLPLCSYASIKIMEEEFNVWNSTIPLAKRLLKKDFPLICREIKEIRKNLKKEVRETIEELGPKMGEEFWKDRVISQEDIIDEKEDLSSNNSIFKYKRRIYHVRQIDDPYNIIKGLEEIF